MVGKGFRCTLRSDDAVKGAKERLPRRRKEREGEEEGRGYSIEDFLPTANNYDTHCIILIDKITPIKLPKKVPIKFITI